MNPPAPRECTNGHPVTDQTADYCATCGTALKARCPNGHLVDPTFDYCDQCGAPLTTSAPEPPTPAIPLITTQPPPVAPSPERRERGDERSKRSLVLAGVALLVLVVVGAAIVLLAGGGSERPAARAVAPTRATTPSEPATTTNAPPTTTAATRAPSTTVVRPDGSIIFPVSPAAATSSVSSLEDALKDENGYAASLYNTPSGWSYGTAGQMQQYTTTHLHYHDSQLAPIVINVKVGGDNSNTVYLGTRAGDGTDTCVYLRAILPVQGATSPDTAWATATPCVQPDEINDWQTNSNPINLLGF